MAMINGSFRASKRLQRYAADHTHSTPWARTDARAWGRLRYAQTVSDTWPAEWSEDAAARGVLLDNAGRPAIVVCRDPDGRRDVWQLSTRSGLRIISAERERGRRIVDAYAEIRDVWTHVGSAARAWIADAKAGNDYKSPEAREALAFAAEIRDTFAAALTEDR